MKEEWRTVPGFPAYSVSNMGIVRNDESNRIMILHVNQRGIVNVSFNRQGRQYKRSVSVLVARAFVPTARSLSFDTPINLDGDRLNNRADNLLWRPRWYATKYFNQFHDPEKVIERSIMEYKTGEIFRSSWDAAIAFGLLNFEVVKSITNKTYAWPTYQRFQICR